MAVQDERRQQPDRTSWATTAPSPADASGRTAEIRYAVITYPGGTVGNAGNPRLSTFDSMTETTSHELAEAVTDPDVTTSAGLVRRRQASEIGDIANGQVDLPERLRGPAASPTRTTRP